MLKKEGNVTAFPSINVFSLAAIYMINVFNENFNTNLKKTTHDCILGYENTLNFNNLVCPYCESRELVSYGSYQRNVISFGEDHLIARLLTVKRVYCKSCKTTHALLPDFIIPYKQYSMPLIITIITYLKEHTLLKTEEYFNININVIKSMYHQYLKFYLLLLKTTFANENKNELLTKYVYDSDLKYQFVTCNKRTFMQMKKRPINCCKF